MESEQSECATVWGDRKGALVCEARMESDFGAFADLLQVLQEIGKVKLG
jgi:hypothetical protein